MRISRTHSPHTSHLPVRFLNFISFLSTQKTAYAFLKPVDVVRLGLKDYKAKIKKPMDFGTIKVSFLLIRRLVPFNKMHST